MPRLLVIGFDGMDYFMARRTIRDYQFKNFKPILKKQLVRETESGPSWACFYTGLNKQIHGITDGWGRNIEGSNTFKDIQAGVFWDIVQRAGYDVYTDNLPITAGGFPYTPDKNKDIVNWVCKPLKKGMGHWRKMISDIGFDEVLSKVRGDSLNLIESERLKKADLSFVQFSFLDRIGHVFSFKERKIISKSYNLAYELIDRLFGQAAPQYLIAVSDHGFWESRAQDHFDATCATAILNDESYLLFAENKLIKAFSVFPALTLRKIRRLCRNLSMAEKLQCLFPSDYIRQVDIFGAILEVFNIDYEKTEYRIPKGEQLQSAQEQEAIKERLKRLGYL